MKKIATPILLSLFLLMPGASLIIHAQQRPVLAKDTTLNRQVLLERDYTPILQDAVKINQLPVIYNPLIQKGSTNFLVDAPSILLNSRLLGKVPSGDIKTTVAMDKKRGYLLLAAGTNANIDGALGYKIVNGENDQLSIFGTHTSTSGNVDYLQQEYLVKEAKAKFAATEANLKYAHRFNPSTLSAEVSYFNTSYNYYGNSFELPIIAIPSTFNTDARQQLEVISGGLGLKSRNAHLLNYDVHAKYSSFNTKYSPLFPEKGVAGGKFDLDLDFSAPFNDNKEIGIKGSLMSQSFDAVSPIIYPLDTYHSYTNITANPYFKIEGEAFLVNLGLKASSLFDVGSSFVVAPALSAQYNTGESSTLYAGVKGGVNDNTFLDILQENRYVNQQARIAYSKTRYDAYMGFRTGLIKGLELDVFGGYKQTDKDHLYIASHTSWGNVSSPLYAKVSTGQLGALLKTNLVPITDLSLRVVRYFYDVAYTNSDANDLPIANYPSLQKAWRKPTFTALLNADVKPTTELTLSLSYEYAGGRKAYLFASNSSLKMKDINELNIRGEYRITNNLSASLRLNNVLAQKYETVYGYALQGFNALGGVSFTF